MFAITNSTEFFAKVRHELAALEEKIDDSGRAMNCILSAYHLHEWVWAHLLKATTPRTLASVVVNDKSSFVAWLETTCPHFLVLQQLTNGTKVLRAGAFDRKDRRIRNGPVRNRAFRRFVSTHRPGRRESSGRSLVGSE
jgi:hypothetical protein